MIKRKARTIPFGYKLAEDPDYIEPIESELEALEEAKEFLKKCGKQVINIHPSLLPKFKGLNTFARAIKNKEKKTGCTVHFVNDKLDGGNIVAQKFFFISSTDNEVVLKQKTQKLEYRAFPEAIIKIFRI